jgi:GTPase Era involved in 16S rRNA processing
MEIVEVFKTNVKTGAQAERLITLIRENFPEYTVNFDLDDCDRILRVKASCIIRESSLLTLLHTSGVDAAVLTDEIPPFMGDHVLMFQQ